MPRIRMSDKQWLNAVKECRASGLSDRSSLRTPASFSPTIFNMIKNLAENVIMLIAGILLTFIAVAFPRRELFFADGYIESERH